MATNRGRLSSMGNHRRDQSTSEPSGDSREFSSRLISVSVEDRSLPDLLSLSGAETMRTKYLVTVFTENNHKDEIQIFQTEAENSSKSVLFIVKLDQETLKSMNGKSKKIRIHVRAQRAAAPGWTEQSPPRWFTKQKRK